MKRKPAPLAVLLAAVLFLNYLLIAGILWGMIYTDSLPVLRWPIILGMTFVSTSLPLLLLGMPLNVRRIFLLDESIRLTSWLGKTSEHSRQDVRLLFSSVMPWGMGKFYRLQVGDTQVRTYLPPSLSRTLEEDFLGLHEAESESSGHSDSVGAVSSPEQRG